MLECKGKNAIDKEVKKAKEGKRGEARLNVYVRMCVKRRERESEREGQKAYALRGRTGTHRMRVRT